MKQRFIYILLFYWVFHFIIPILGYLYYGEFINLYSDIIGYDGMIINTIVVTITICIVYFLPSKKYATFVPFNHAKSFFIISLSLAIYKFFIGGKYAGALEGSTNGMFISYLSMFFRKDVAFFLLFCLQKNFKSLFVYILLYVVLVTITGSRSAVIAVFFLYLYLPFFSYRKQMVSRLKKIVLFVALISPLLFFYGTSVRGDIDKDLLGKIIIGRISLIEVSTIPIKQKEDRSMDMTVYNEKYSLSNQLKQSFNAISPIDPFEDDIAPNQYYRQIFLGRSFSFVQNSYMSINMTLPAYFVLMSNKYIGSILSVIFLVFLYLFWYKFSNNIYIFFMIFFCIYEMLYFFDFVMIIQHMFFIFLTLLALGKYEFVLNAFSTSLKKILQKRATNMRT